MVEAWIKEQEPPAESAAVQAITEVGPGGVSLRDLARRAGVSHAAPAHHFGDKAGLLAALAAEGYGLLADALAAAQQRTQDFLEVGVAYVRFAVEHRAHFEVMFRPDLYHPDDPALRAARERASNALSGGIGSLPSGRAGTDARIAGVAAWSPELGDDPEALGRAVAAILFRAP
jgi:AcrR family transcriptional regulator